MKNQWDKGQRIFSRIFCLLILELFLVSNMNLTDAFASVQEWAQNDLAKGQNLAARSNFRDGKMRQEMEKAYKERAKKTAEKQGKELPNSVFEVKSPVKSPNVRPSQISASNNRALQDLLMPKNNSIYGLDYEIPGVSEQFYDYLPGVTAESFESSFFSQEVLDELNAIEVAKRRASKRRGQVREGQEQRIKEEVRAIAAELAAAYQKLRKESSRGFLDQSDASAVNATFERILSQYSQGVSLQGRELPLLLVRYAKLSSADSKKAGQIRAKVLEMQNRDVASIEGRSFYDGRLEAYVRLGEVESLRSLLGPARLSAEQRAQQIIRGEDVSAQRPSTAQEQELNAALDALDSLRSMSLSLDVQSRSLRDYASNNTDRNEQEYRQLLKRGVDAQELLERELSSGASIDEALGRLHKSIGEDLQKSFQRVHGQDPQNLWTSIANVAREIGRADQFLRDYNKDGKTPDTEIFEQRLDVLLGDLFDRDRSDDRDRYEQVLNDYAAAYAAAQDRKVSADVFANMPVHLNNLKAAMIKPRDTMKKLLLAEGAPANRRDKQIEELKDSRSQSIDQFVKLAEETQFFDFGRYGAQLAALGRLHHKGDRAMDERDASAALKIFFENLTEQSLQKPDVRLILDSYLEATRGKLVDGVSLYEAIEQGGTSQNESLLQTNQRLKDLNDTRDELKDSLSDVQAFEEAFRQVAIFLNQKDYREMLEQAGAVSPQAMKDLSKKIREYAKQDSPSKAREWLRKEFLGDRKDDLKQMVEVLSQIMQIDLKTIETLQAGLDEQKRNEASDAQGRLASAKSAYDALIRDEQSDSRRRRIERTIGQLQSYADEAYGDRAKFVSQAVDVLNFEYKDEGLTDKALDYARLRALRRESEARVRGQQIYTLLLEDQRNLLRTDSLISAHGLIMEYVLAHAHKGINQKSNARSFAQSLAELLAKNGQIEQRQLRAVQDLIRKDVLQKDFEALRSSVQNRQGRNAQIQTQVFKQVEETQRLRQIVDSKNSFDLLKRMIAQVQRGEISLDSNTREYLKALADSSAYLLDGRNNIPQDPEVVNAWSQISSALEGMGIESAQLTSPRSVKKRIERKRLVKDAQKEREAEDFLRKTINERLNREFTAEGITVKFEFDSTAKADQSLKMLVQKDGQSLYTSKVLNPYNLGQSLADLGKVDLDANGTFEFEYDGQSGKFALSKKSSGPVNEALQNFTEQENDLFDFQAESSQTLDEAYRSLTEAHRDIVAEAEQVIAELKAANVGDLGQKGKFFSKNNRWFLSSGVVVSFLTMFSLYLIQAAAVASSTAAGFSGFGSASQAVAIAVSGVGLSSNFMFMPIFVWGLVALAAYWGVGYMLTKHGSKIPGLRRNVQRLDGAGLVIFQGMMVIGVAAASLIGFIPAAQVFGVTGILAALSLGGGLGFIVFLAAAVIMGFILINAFTWISKEWRESQKRDNEQKNRKTFINDEASQTYIGLRMIGMEPSEIKSILRKKEVLSVIDDEYDNIDLVWRAIQNNTEEEVNTSLAKRRWEAYQKFDQYIRSLPLDETPDESHLKTLRGHLKDMSADGREALNFPDDILDNLKAQAPKQDDIQKQQQAEDLSKVELPEGQTVYANRAINAEDFSAVIGALDSFYKAREELKEEIEELEETVWQEEMPQAEREVLASATQEFSKQEEPQTTHQDLQKYAEQVEDTQKDRPNTNTALVPLVASGDSNVQFVENQVAPSQSTFEQNPEALGLVDVQNAPVQVLDNGALIDQPFIESASSQAEAQDVLDRELQEMAEEITDSLKESELVELAEDVLDNPAREQEMTEEIVELLKENDFQNINQVRPVPTVIVEELAKQNFLVAKEARENVNDLVDLVSLEASRDPEVAKQHQDLKVAVSNAREADEKVDEIVDRSAEARVFEALGVDAKDYQAPLIAYKKGQIDAKEAAEQATEDPAVQTQIARELDSLATKTIEQDAVREAAQTVKETVSIQEPISEIQSQSLQEINESLFASDAALPALQSAGRLSRVAIAILAIAGFAGLALGVASLLPFIGAVSFPLLPAILMVSAGVGFLGGSMLLAVRENRARTAQGAVIATSFLSGSTLLGFSIVAGLMSTSMPLFALAGILFALGIVSSIVMGFLTPSSAQREAQSILREQAQRKSTAADDFSATEADEEIEEPETLKQQQQRRLAQVLSFAGVFIGTLAVAASMLVISAPALQIIALFAGASVIAYSAGAGIRYLKTPRARLIMFGLTSLIALGGGVLVVSVSSPAFVFVGYLISVAIGLGLGLFARNNPELNPAFAQRGHALVHSNAFRLATMALLWGGYAAASALGATPALIGLLFLSATLLSAMFALNVLLVQPLRKRFFPTEEQREARKLAKEEGRMGKIQSWFYRVGEDGERKLNRDRAAFALIVFASLVTLIVLFSVLPGAAFIPMLYQETAVFWEWIWEGLKWFGTAITNGFSNIVEAMEAVSFDSLSVGGTEVSSSSFTGLSSGSVADFFSGIPEALTGNASVASNEAWKGFLAIAAAVTAMYAFTYGFYSKVMKNSRAVQESSLRDYTELQMAQEIERRAKAKKVRNTVLSLVISTSLIGFVAASIVLGGFPALVTFMGASFMIFFGLIKLVDSIVESFGDSSRNATVTTDDGQKLRPVLPAGVRFAAPLLAISFGAGIFALSALVSGPLWALFVLPMIVATIALTVMLLFRQNAHYSKIASAADNYGQERKDRLAQTAEKLWGPLGIQPEESPTAMLETLNSEDPQAHWKAYLQMVTMLERIRTNQGDSDLSLDDRESGDALASVRRAAIHPEVLARLRVEISDVQSSLARELKFYESYVYSKYPELRNEVLNVGAIGDFVQEDSPVTQSAETEQQAQEEALRTQNIESARLEELVASEGQLDSQEVLKDTQQKANQQKAQRTGKTLDLVRENFQSATRISDLRKSAGLLATATYNWNSQSRLPYSLRRLNSERQDGKFLAEFRRLLPAVGMTSDLESFLAKIDQLSIDQVQDVAVPAYLKKNAKNLDKARTDQQIRNELKKIRTMLHNQAGYYAADSALDKVINAKGYSDTLQSLRELHELIEGADASAALLPLAEFSETFQGMLERGEVAQGTDGLKKAQKRIGSLGARATMYDMRTAILDSLGAVSTLPEAMRKNIQRLETNSDDYGAEFRTVLENLSIDITANEDLGVDGLNQVIERYIEELIKLDEDRTALLEKIRDDQLKVAQKERELRQYMQRHYRKLGIHDQLLGRKRAKEFARLMTRRGSDRDFVKDLRVFMTSDPQMLKSFFGAQAFNDIEESLRLVINNGQDIEDVLSKQLTAIDQKFANNANGYTVDEAKNLVASVERSFREAALLPMQTVREDMQEVRDSVSFVRDVSRLTYASMMEVSQYNITQVDRLLEEHEIREAIYLKASQRTAEYAKQKQEQLAGKIEEIRRNNQNQLDAQGRIEAAGQQLLEEMSWELKSVYAQIVEQSGLEDPELTQKIKKDLAALAEYRGGFTRDAMKYFTHLGKVVETGKAYNPLFQAALTERSLEAWVEKSLTMGNEALASRAEKYAQEEKQVKEALQAMKTATEQFSQVWLELNNLDDVAGDSQLDELREKMLDENRQFRDLSGNTHPEGLDAYIDDLENSLEQEEDAKRRIALQRELRHAMDYYLNRMQELNENWQKALQAMEALPELPERGAFAQLYDQMRESMQVNMYTTDSSRVRSHKLKSKFFRLKAYKLSERKKRIRDRVQRYVDLRDENAELVKWQSNYLDLRVQSLEGPLVEAFEDHTNKVLARANQVLSSLKQNASQNKTKIAQLSIAIQDVQNAQGQKAGRIENIYELNMRLNDLEQSILYYGSTALDSDLLRLAEEISTQPVDPAEFWKTIKRINNTDEGKSKTDARVGRKSSWKKVFDKLRGTMPNTSLYVYALEKGVQLEDVKDAQGLKKAMLGMIKDLKGRKDEYKGEESQSIISAMLSYEKQLQSANTPIQIVEVAVALSSDAQVKKLGLKIDGGIEAIAKADANSAKIWQYWAAVKIRALDTEQSSAEDDIKVLLELQGKEGVSAELKNALSLLAEDKELYEAAVALDGFMRTATLEPFLSKQLEDRRGVSEQVEQSASQKFAQVRSTIQSLARDEGDYNQSNARARYRAITSKVLDVPMIDRLIALDSSLEERLLPIRGVPFSRQESEVELLSAIQSIVLSSIVKKADDLEVRNLAKELEAVFKKVAPYREQLIARSEVAIRSAENFKELKRNVGSIMRIWKATYPTYNDQSYPEFSLANIEGEKMDDGKMVTMMKSVRDFKEPWFADLASAMDDKYQDFAARKVVRIAEASNDLANKKKVKTMADAVKVLSDLHNFIGTAKEGSGIDLKVQALVRQIASAPADKRVQILSDAIKDADEYPSLFSEDALIYLNALSKKDEQDRLIRKSADTIFAAKKKWSEKVQKAIEDIATVVENTETKLDGKRLSMLEALHNISQKPVSADDKEIKGDIAGFMASYGTQVGSISGNLQKALNDFAEVKPETFQPRGTAQEALDVTELSQLTSLLGKYIRENRDQQKEFDLIKKQIAKDIRDLESKRDRARDAEERRTYNDELSQLRNADRNLYETLLRDGAYEGLSLSQTRELAYFEDAYKAVQGIKAVRSVLTRSLNAENFSEQIEKAAEEASKAGAQTLASKLYDVAQAGKDDLKSFRGDYANMFRDQRKGQARWIDKGSYEKITRALDRILKDKDKSEGDLDASAATGTSTQVMPDQDGFKDQNGRFVFNPIAQSEDLDNAVQSEDQTLNATVQKVVQKFGQTEFFGAEDIVVKVIPKAPFKVFNRGGEIFVHQSLLDDIQQGRVEPIALEVALFEEYVEILAGSHLSAPSWEDLQSGATQDDIRKHAEQMVDQKESISTLMALQLGGYSADQIDQIRDQQQGMLSRLNQQLVAAHGVHRDQIEGIVFGVQERIEMLNDISQYLRSNNQDSLDIFSFDPDQGFGLPTEGPKLEVIDRVKQALTLAVNA